MRARGVRPCVARRPRSETISMAAARVGDLAGHRRGEPAALGERLQRRHLLRGRARAGLRRRSTPSSGTISRSKRPSSIAARRARWWLSTANASMSSRVIVPLLGDHLGAAELRDRLVAVARRPSPREPENGSSKPSGCGRPSWRTRSGSWLMFCTPPAIDDVAGAAHHRLGGEVHRLLGRAALPVDRGARAPPPAARRPASRCGRCRRPAGRSVSTQPKTTSSTAAGIDVRCGRRARVSDVRAEVGGVDAAPGRRRAGRPACGRHRRCRPRGRSAASVRLLVLGVVTEIYAWREGSAGAGAIAFK